MIRLADEDLILANLLACVRAACQSWFWETCGWNGFTSSRFLWTCVHHSDCSREACLFRIGCCPTVCCSVAAVLHAWLLALSCQKGFQTDGYFLVVAFAQGWPLTSFACLASWLEQAKITRLKRQTLNRMGIYFSPCQNKEHEQTSKQWIHNHLSSNSQSTWEPTINQCDFLPSLSLLFSHLCFLDCLPFLAASITTSKRKSRAHPRPSEAPGGFWGFTGFARGKPVAAVAESLRMCCWWCWRTTARETSGFRSVESQRPAFDTSFPRDGVHDTWATSLSHWHLLSTHQVTCSLRLDYLDVLACSIVWSRAGCLACTFSSWHSAKMWRREFPGARNYCQTTRSENCCSIDVPSCHLVTHFGSMCQPWCTSRWSYN